MAVIATLVVGADGSTTKGGTSQGVTSGADRAQFLEHRRLADCIFIGGNTARTEPYLRTPVPVVVISHQLDNPLASNPLAHLWNLSPVAGLVKAIETFGPRIHVEAGATMISELIAARISRSGADLFRYDDAPAFMEARRKSSCSLRVRTMMAIVCDIERAQETISKPLPSGRLISTTMTSGLTFAIWANASYFDAA